MVLSERSAKLAIGLLTVVSYGILFAWPSVADEVSSVHGSGKWKADAIAQRPALRWTIDALSFTDGLLRGRLSVGGSGFTKGGNLEGKVSGDSVGGFVYDDAGMPVLRFSGTISKSRIVGRYEDRSGESGDWSWEGEFPRQAVVTEKSE